MTYILADLPFGTCTYHIVIQLPNSVRVPPHPRAMRLGITKKNRDKHQRKGWGRILEMYETVAVGGERMKHKYEPTNGQPRSRAWAHQASGLEFQVYTGALPLSVDQQGRRRSRCEPVVRT